MKLPKYMVWDVQEMLQICTKEELGFLNYIIETIKKSREEKGINPDKKYAIVGDDEPYYQTVVEFINSMKKVHNRD